MMMNYRTFGRTGWKVSEIGYGMWGMAGWTGSDDDETNRSLDLAVEMGCNFFDTAWGYGAGASEKILGNLIKKNSAKKLYSASKIPPKNFKWPSKPEYKLDDCFPADHIIKYTEMSLKNLGLETIDLMQFHVWEDAWANDDRWKEAVIKLKKEGKIQSMGISVNRWEPENCINSLDTGLIDAIQVIYNIFDQAPEDKLFPAVEKLNIAVIARVPFDEGTLTGKLSQETQFPKDDWRSTYFVPENLNASVDHAERLKSLVPQGMDMPEMALRFILSNKTVSTTIPGMRKPAHAKINLQAGDGKGLNAELLQQLKKHRWDRLPTSWSQ
jgi:aryl-alcohol dehydrogenase-like predicted oxidoreductase